MYDNDFGVYNTVLSYDVKKQMYGGVDGLIVPKEDVFNEHQLSDLVEVEKHADKMLVCEIMSTGKVMVFKKYNPINPSAGFYRGPIERVSLSADGRVDLNMVTKIPYGLKPHEGSVSENVRPGLPADMDLNYDFDHEVPEAVLVYKMSAGLYKNKVHRILSVPNQVEYYIEKITKHSGQDVRVTRIKSRLVSDTEKYLKEYKTDGETLDFFLANKEKLLAGKLRDLKILKKLACSLLKCGEICPDGKVMVLAKRPTADDRTRSLENTWTLLTTVQNHYTAVPDV